MSSNTEKGRAAAGTSNRLRAASKRIQRDLLTLDREIVVHVDEIIGPLLRKREIIFAEFKVLAEKPILTVEERKQYEAKKHAVKALDTRIDKLMLDRQEVIDEASKLFSKIAAQALGEALKPKAQLPITGAIKDTLTKLGKPGRDIPWARFCDSVRQKCGVVASARGFGDKTIRKAVLEIDAVE